MRLTLLAILASATIVSAGGCAQSSIEDLVAETACGPVDAITECLKMADFQRLDEIERCYSSNGCTDGEATVEAVWFAKDCRPIENTRGDLKRRADSADSSTQESTSAKTTAKNTAKTTASAKTTSAPSSTSATTTADTSTTEASTTTSAATTATSTSSTSSASAKTTGTSSTTSGSTTAPLTCSVTSTKSTSVCQTTSGTSTCVATTTDIASCAPGLICFSPTAGADVGLCMRRDNSLTTSGLIVTLVFGAALAATVIAFVVMGLRNSKKAKQQEHSRQIAAASTRGGDVEAQSFSKANRSEAALPLITPGGSRSDQYGTQPQQDYFEQSTGGGGNSVTPPAGRAAPQLHPGLGALGQDTRY